MMAKNNKQRTSAGTNINEVRQQNAQSAQGAQGQNPFGTEFAAETDAQQVRQQNAQSQARKNRPSGNQ